MGNGSPEVHAVQFMRRRARVDMHSESGCAGKGLISKAKDGLVVSCELGSSIMNLGEQIEYPCIVTGLLDQVVKLHA